MNRGCQLRAFSLAETLISLVLVSGLLVVSFDCFGSSAVAEKLEADRARAHLLAAGRLSAIMQTAYEDPVAPITFGREVDELALTVPELDDVDDFDDLSETLDLSAAGSTWTRTTQVVLANPAAPSGNSLTDEGAKRIIVEVKLNNRVLATLVAIRTGGGSEPEVQLLEAILE